MEADERESRPGRGEPRRLGIERLEVGEVLVDETGDDEVVGGGVEAGVRDFRLA